MEGFLNYSGECLSCIYCIRFDIEVILNDIQILTFRFSQNSFGMFFFVL